MYWNVHKLAIALKENRVTEPDKFIYFILLAIPYLFPNYTLRNNQLTIETVIISIITFIISIAGIFICYHANKTGDNKNFIERIICLCVPISIKISLTVLALGYLLILLNYNLDPEQQAIINKYVLPSLVILGSILLYGWLYKKIKFIAH